MTSECESNLTCIDMTCIWMTFGNDCTMDNQCVRINGAVVGECRKQMCSNVPAAMDGELCFYDHECDEDSICIDDSC